MTPPTWCNILTCRDVLIFFAVHCKPTMPDTHWYHYIQQAQLQNFPKDVAKMSSAHSTTSRPQGDKEFSKETLSTNIGQWPAAHTKPPYDEHCSPGKKSYSLAKLPLTVPMTKYCPHGPHHISSAYDTCTGTKWALSWIYYWHSTNPKYTALKPPVPKLHYTDLCGSTHTNNIWQKPTMTTLALIGL